MKKFTGTVQTALATQQGLPTAIAPAVPEIATQSVVAVLPTIKKADGSPVATYDQALALAGIKLISGEPLLTLTDRYFVYEVTNLLNRLDYEVVYNFLTADWHKVFGNVHDIRKKILFENPLLDPAREKLKMDMEIFRGKVDVGVGAIDCRKCGSKETISVEKQLRSCDEPMSIFVTCLQCGNKWQAQ